MARFTDAQIRAHLDGLSTEARAEALTKATLALQAKPLGPRQASSVPVSTARGGTSPARTTPTRSK